MNKSIRLILILLFLSCSITGFMIKLPSAFRHFDKELHSLFYFGAAAFLNILFLTKSLKKHLIFLISLILFGLGIEYAQEYSNKFFRSRIHGSFDIEDVKYNMIGLISFSLIWLLIYIFIKIKSNIK